LNGIEDVSVLIEDDFISIAAAAVVHLVFRYRLILSILGIERLAIF
jgi:hypothetical protein